jgi:SAM-dependent MidA family methyltransferase
VMRSGGTLVSYSSSGADTEVLESPGTKDITAHANWTSVTHSLARGGSLPVGPKPQREVLLKLGAHDLEDSFKAAYNDAIADGRGAEAVAALSRRQALGALLDPGGLGGLQVLAGLRSIEPPSFLD